MLRTYNSELIYDLASDYLYTKVNGFKLIYMLCIIDINFFLHSYKCSNLSHDTMIISRLHMQMLQFLNDR